MCNVFALQVTLVRRIFSLRGNINSALNCTRHSSQVWIASLNTLMPNNVVKFSLSICQPLLQTDHCVDHCKEKLASWIVAPSENGPCIAHRLISGGSLQQINVSFAQFIWMECYKLDLGNLLLDRPCLNSSNITFKPCLATASIVKQSIPLLKVFSWFAGTILPYPASDFASNLVLLICCCTANFSTSQPHPSCYGSLPLVVSQRNTCGEGPAGALALLLDSSEGVPTNQYIT